MVSPINSVKHYVHKTNATLASGAAINIVLVDSVVAPAVANPFDVKTGAVIKAVHIEIWVLGAGVSETDIQFGAFLEKIENGVAAMTFAQSLNLGAYDNKKNILYTTQGVTSSQVDGSIPLALMRSWFKIPKGKQRFGQGDRLVLTVNSVGGSLQVCGLTTYKEYF